MTSPGPASGAFAKARAMEKELARRYNLTFVDTCAAFSFMLPRGGSPPGPAPAPTPASAPAHRAAAASSCAGIKHEAPLFDHPTVGYCRSTPACPLVDRARFLRLNLSYGKLLSNFAFDFNMRRNTTAMQPVFFANETGRAGGDTPRFDWLHYRYEGVALQACLLAHAALIPHVRWGSAIHEIYAKP